MLKNKADTYSQAAVAARSATPQLHMHLFFALVAALWVMLSPSLARAEAGERYMLKHDSVEREYYVYNPKKNNDRPRPLVVVLHGGGGGPRQVARSTGFSELADEQGFLVAYPKGLGHVPTWNAGKCCGYAERKEIDDVGFIDAMLKDIRERYAVQPERIFVTGMSNGGMMAYRLGCELSGTFAAIAPVAGAFNVDPAQCKPEGRPSVVIFHAIDDRHVRYEGGYSEEGVRARIGRSLAPDASIADAMRFWMKADYCRDFPGQEEMTGYRKVTYFCAEDRNVVLYTLDQGGHSWPKEPLDATDEIWRFFRQHPPQEVF